MQYTYSKKSFARDVFDAAKAKLQTPVPDLLALSNQWPGLINYGLQKPLLSKWSQFRSVEGNRLCTGSVPLCTYSPEDIARLPYKKSVLPPQMDAEAEFAERVAAMQALEAYGNLNPADNPHAAQELPFDEESPADAGLGRTSVRSFSPRIPTAVLSTFLSVAAAIAAGLIIANGNTFKFRHDATGVPQAADAPASSDRIAVNESSAARLAMDTTLPQSSGSFPAVSESGPGLQSSSGKKSEPHGKRVQAAEKKSRRTEAESRPPKRLASTTATPKAVKTAQSSKAHAPRPAPVVAAKSGNSLHARQSEHHPGTQYARCNNVKGLLQRERCKWNACGDRWGKQGCPAY